MKTPIPLRKNEQRFIKDKINIVKKSFKAALKKKLLPITNITTSTITVKVKMMVVTSRRER